MMTWQLPSNVCKVVQSGQPSAKEHTFKVKGTILFLAQRFAMFKQAYSKTNA